jgi:hypothetical protein
MLIIRALREEDCLTYEILPHFVQIDSSDSHGMAGNASNRMVEIAKPLFSAHWASPDPPVGSGG